MTDVDVTGEDKSGDVVESATVVETWPLTSLLQELEKLKPRDIVNAENLGALRFTGADGQFQEIINILRDLRMEDWSDLPADVAAEIQTTTDAVLGAAREMIALTPTANEPRFRQQRNRLETQFSEYYSFFRNRVRPLCLTSRLAHLLRTRSDLWGGDLSQERVSELQQTFDRLEQTAAEFQTLSQLVEAQRELVGDSGAAKLSHDFDDRAENHARSFKWWAWGLVASVVLGGVAAVLFVYLSRPPNNGTNAEIVTHVILDILVLGLIVFLVRFVALQTRAHRHMQFVAKNKANALSTFNRMVAGQQDPDVRANIAAALAHAVFKSDDGIFSDASSDTVTVYERMGAFLSSRVPGA